ncbi:MULTISPECIES: type II toxin-antitoxin system HipA family toxin [unclassified Brevibacterium]|uniref:type II toxin-antitoxin system HipA family toxin n=1 Tax=unclassified Brevibacterium TaxID=2614124 RepID=UPI0010927620|nr:type II toxin-antitoxin system HipA family toxin [Brevibacterium sp. S22]TGD26057.1 type II toxin-antitoxin system HipA family toxin [Brevibacterium sp. S22]
MSEQIRVEIDHRGTSVFVGTAYFHIARGQISTTFKYSDEYAGARWAYSIDPELPLSTAPFSVPGLPGAFSDSAPDRWGRNLVTKEHRRQVTEGMARDRRLTDIDFLLGVSDHTRQGALRFRRAAGDHFLSPTHRVPKLLSLPELQRAADGAAEGSGTAVKRLLEAGTASLGGARPKASVADDEGRLLIAKFSRPDDERDVIAWESVALELARNAGIETSESQLLIIEQRPVLLLERFDRMPDHRIGYMSAMTATGRRDGEAGDYLDIVEAIEDHSRRWRHDCAELFRRVVFSAAMHNTDDHLRNHGFIRSDAGWQLSPAFDINPEPEAAVERQTAINGNVAAESEVEALLEFASLCHLTKPAAVSVFNEVVNAVSGWKSLAASRGIRRSEITEMGSVIDVQLARLQIAIDR